MSKLVDKGLKAKRESKHVDFKSSFDEESPGEWCELVKDIVAMANSGGGVNAETVKALGREDVKSKVAAQGLEVSPSTPEQFAEHIKSEIARFTKIAKAAGIKAE